MVDAQFVDEEHSSPRPHTLRRQLTEKFGPVALTAGPPALVREQSWVTQLLGRSAVQFDALRPTLVIGVLYLSRPVPRPALRAHLTEHLVKLMPRFGSVLRVTVDGDLVFCPCSEVDMNYHVQSLPTPGGAAWTERELLEYCESWATRDMDPEQPLWQFLVVDALADGRSAIVAVIDHSIGDGMSLVAALLSLLDEPDAETAASAALPTLALQQRARRRGVFGSIASLCSAQNLRRLVGAPFAILKLVRALAIEDTRNALYGGADTSPGALVPSASRSIAFTDPVPLATVKAIRTAYGTRYGGERLTINDVVCAIATITLRKYFDSVGERPSRVRAVLIFNLNSAPAAPAAPSATGEAPVMTNASGSVVFEFPIGYKSHAALLAAVHAQMRYIKSSVLPFASWALYSKLIPLMIRSGTLEKTFSSDDCYKTTANLTNVPGPQYAARLLGTPLDDLRFLTTSPTHLALCVNSYNGTLNASIVVNAQREPNASAIGCHWRAAADELHAAVCA